MFYVPHKIREMESTGIRIRIFSFCHLNTKGEKMLKVSFILTTYNSRDNFLRTYNSITKQTYPDMEIIVIDGGSVDGTREAIASKAAENPGLHWISEKDTGIYNAMNKGLRMASGDIIACFNDEFTTPDAVSQYVSILEREKTDAAHSDLCYVDHTGKRIRKWRMGTGQIEKGWMPAHPTLFARRELYDKYGVYKEDYLCAADYEWMIRILKDGSTRLSYIPQQLVAMAYGGTSSSGIKAYLLSFRESVRALRENRIKGALRITLLRSLRVLRQF